MVISYRKYYLGLPELFTRTARHNIIEPVSGKRTVTLNDL